MYCAAEAVVVSSRTFIVFGYAFSFWILHNKSADAIIQFLKSALSLLVHHLGLLETCDLEYFRINLLDNERMNEWDGL